MQSRRKSQAFPLRDNRYPTKAGQTTKSTMKTTKAQKDLCLLRLRFVPFVYLQISPDLGKIELNPISRKTSRLRSAPPGISTGGCREFRGTSGLTAQVSQWFPDRLILPTVPYGIRNDRIECRLNA